MNLGSNHFQTYVNNLQRLYLADFIDRLSLEASRKPFRACLVANPIESRNQDVATEPG